MKREKIANILQDSGLPTDVALLDFVLQGSRKANGRKRLSEIEWSNCGSWVYYKFKMNSQFSICQYLEQSDLKVFILSNDKYNIPHLQVAQPLIFENQTLYYPEFDEYSRNNLNLLNSLWFKRTVVIYLSSQVLPPISLQVQVYKSIIAGPLFQQYYQHFQDQVPSQALSTLWQFKIKYWQEESPEAQTQRDQLNRQSLVHLDQIAQSLALYNAPPLHAHKYHS